MKITLRGRIQKTEESPNGELVSIEVNQLTGAVEAPPNVSSKEAKGKVLFCVKPLVAQKLHIGETVRVTIEADPPE